MSWRVVAITQRSKLDYKLGCLVVRSGEEEKRIHLGDIAVLMCETTAISMTAYLLAELTSRQIKVIFCDHKHNPTAELIPYYGSFDTSSKIREQITWSEEIKAYVWQEIIKAKIRRQAMVLEKLKHQSKATQLLAYADQVQPADASNREGHAAKVYFNTLFDKHFSRDSDNTINAVLDYGYTVLLSCFNRSIVASGYLTQLGIWHRHTENPFNFGSDLMESFRPLVDYLAATCHWETFGKDEKMTVLDLLNTQVMIAESKQYVSNAIDIYVHSIFRALAKNDVSQIQNWYEL